MDDFQPTFWPLVKLRKITAAVVRPFSTIEPDDSSLRGRDY
jgi:hypothetical protein